MRTYRSKGVETNWTHRVNTEFVHRHAMAGDGSDAGRVSLYRAMPRARCPQPTASAGLPSWQIAYDLLNAA
jgi:hypothetical protein